jgi:hypothetical protein
MNQQNENPEVIPEEDIPQFEGNVVGYDAQSLCQSIIAELQKATDEQHLSRKTGFILGNLFMDWADQLGKSGMTTINLPEGL